MVIEKDEFRTIIEDTRVRHAALVALIYATDAQAYVRRCRLFFVREI
jgi:hypothetical protein